MGFSAAMSRGDLELVQGPGSRVQGSDLTLFCHVGFHDTF